VGRSVFPPYATPSPDDVSFDLWSLSTGAASVKVGDDRVEGWDHTVDLEASVEVLADPQHLAMSCSLGRGSRFRAVLGWHATGSGLRGVVASVPIGPGGRTVAGGRLEGPRLGGSLRLTASVVLEHAEDAGPVAPATTGSVLIREHRSWMLEGIGSRFPVEMLDFQKAGIRHPAAAWVIRWDRREPEWDARAAVRLQVNSGHPLATLLADPESEEAALLHTVMRRDVLRDLVSTATELEGFSIELGAWPEGSLGQSLSLLLASVFPDLSIEEIRSLRRDDTAAFEAVLQGTTRFLDPAPRT